MHVCLPTIGSLHDIMKYESSISKVELVNHEWVPQNNGGIGLSLHKWALCGKEKCEFHLSTTVILPFKYCCSVYQVVRAYFHLILHGNRLWHVYFPTEPLDRSLLWGLSKQTTLGIHDTCLSIHQWSQRLALFYPLQKGVG